MDLSDTIVKNSIGGSSLLLGNQAIARGAIEAGVKVVTGYPGTPSTEIIETLCSVANELGIRVMWNINEKIAFEAALGASFADQRALVTMKAPGLSVAIDAVQTASYCGCNGGLVLVVADDPGPHTTSTEQDSRFAIAHMNLLPMIEPSDPQEAKEIMVKAFEISEKIQLPVIVRTTTRVNHTTGKVTFGPIQKIERPAIFLKNPPRYVAPLKTRDRHHWLNGQMEKAANLLEDLRFNKLEMKGDEKVGIIATGVSYHYVMELIRKHNLAEVAVLKVAALNPLPLNMFKKLLQLVDKVLVVEELEPYIELHSKVVVSDLGKDLHILGKLDGSLPRVGEYNLDLIETAISKLLKRPLATNIDLIELVNESKSITPSRAPPMCAGCPHRSSYYAIKNAIQESGHKIKDIPIMGDVGCYCLSFQPPLEAIWFQHCMGSSISAAAGLKYGGFDKPVIATIGDSTFYHSGLPALLDAIYNNAKNLCVIIMDNGITAMTGHQPNPSTGITAIGDESVFISPEEIAKAMGVEFIRVTDPYNFKETTETIKEALKFPGVSFVVLRRLCALVARRRKIDYGSPYEIDPDKCIGCKTCISQFCCLAFRWDEKANKALIDPFSCIGCGFCAQICPHGAIIR